MGSPRQAGQRHGNPIAEAPGELRLIQYIRARAAAAAGSGTRRALQLGIGDDCAILRPRRGEDLVVTTDFSLEGRHFRRDWHSAGSAGHRTLARGLSDLAAMGARPVAAFLSLALPRDLSTDKGWVEGFFDGLLTLAKQVDVPLAGGDTAEAPGAHILADIVLLGAVPAGRALRRDGARAGDRLFCSGALGGAAAELQGLAGAASPRSKRSVFPSPTNMLSGAHPQLFPAPRLGVGQMLLRRRLATAAIDLSDGLSTDLQHLCAASGVAAAVEAARLPLHTLAVEQGNRKGPGTALDLALNGGEDYELLFTVPAAARVPRRLGGVALTEIGQVVRPRRGQPTVTLIHADGARSALKAGGWEHLR